MQTRGASRVNPGFARSKHGVHTVKPRVYRISDSPGSSQNLPKASDLRKILEIPIKNVISDNRTTS